MRRRPALWMSVVKVRVRLVGLLGGLGQSSLASGAVDADALACIAGGEDVSGSLPAAVLALVDGPVAVVVGSDAAGGGGVAGRGHQAAACRAGSCGPGVHRDAGRASYKPL